MQWRIHNLLRSKRSSFRSVLCFCSGKKSTLLWERGKYGFHYKMRLIPGALHSSSDNEVQVQMGTRITEHWYTTELGVLGSPFVRLWQELMEQGWGHGAILKCHAMYLRRALVARVHLSILHCSEQKEMISQARTRTES